MAVKTRAQIQAESNTTYIDNSVGSITPANVRTLNDDWTDSTVFLTETGSLTVASASVAISSSYALSASHSENADDAISASFALTASYISGNVASASYALSASFASSATSASYAISSSLSQNSKSASVSISSSYASSSTLTSVVTDNGNTSHRVVFVNESTDSGNVQLLIDANDLTYNPNQNLLSTTASYSNFAISSSQSDNSISASYALTASVLLGAVVSASYALSASFASTASYVLNAVSASRSVSASRADSSLSSSYALSASYAANVPATASYALQALSSSYAVTASHALSIQDNINATFNNVTASNVQITGTASVAFLNVQFQSSSVIYSSGSNILGDAANDTQTLWGTVDIISGPLKVTGSADFQGGLTGSLLGTASYASQGLSSSFAQTASYVENAQSASYVLNAVSASYAVSAAYAPDTTFPYTGNAIVSGTLAIVGTGAGIDQLNLLLRSGSSMFLAPRNTPGTTTVDVGLNTLVTQSYAAAVGGANIVSLYATPANTGSVVISGSQNIVLLGTGGSNALVTSGAQYGFNGNRNIILGSIPRLNGGTSTNKGLLNIQTSWITSGPSVNDKGPVYSDGTSNFAASNTFFNSLVTANINSGSVSFGNTNVNASTTLNNNWSGSTFTNTNNIYLGSGNTLTTENFSSAAVPNTIGIQNSIVATNTGTIFFPSASVNNSQLQSSIIFGNQLIVTGSTNASTLANRGSAVFGRNNANDGITNSVDQSIFAVGTGTSLTARRTSLIVSASGLTVVNDGIKISGSLQMTGSANFNSGITGSLLGTASFADICGLAITATSSSFASNAATASYVNQLNQDVTISQQLNVDTINGFTGDLTLSPAVFPGYVKTANFKVDSIEAFNSSYIAVSSNLEVLSNSITASGFSGPLEGTASYANQALSSSYALTASFYAGTVNTASFASTSSYINPLNQAVVITGSVQGNVVSASISSNTSSLDFSLGNFFTSAVSASTFFNVTNVKPGQTVNVLLTTVGTGSATFSSNVKQPSGSAYVPTVGSDKKDVLTFASWDSSNVYLVSVKNLI